MRFVRLHGRGRCVTLYDEGFDDLLARFDGGVDESLGARAVVVVDVERVSDSCGFSVPHMDFVADRDVLDRSHERRSPEYFEVYWRERNAASLDGLPAIGDGPRTVEATTPPAALGR